MVRFTQHILNLSLALAAMLAFGVFPLHASEDAMTLDQLRAFVREELTSIASVSCSFRLKYSKEDGDDPQNWPVHEWAEQGHKKLCRMLPHQNYLMKRKGQWLQEWNSYDGQTGYLVIFRMDSPEIDVVQRFDRVPEKCQTYAIPGQYLGRTIHGSNESLLDLLMRADARFRNTGGLIDFQGHKCWMVDLGPYDLEGSKLNYLRVWFDPEFGYLPRRIESVPVRFVDASSNDQRRNFAFAPGEALWFTEVGDFMPVEDPALGRSRWFPKTLKHTGKITSVVESVRINQPLADDAFVPKLSPGVRVIYNPRSTNERIEVIGGSPQPTKPVEVQSANTTPPTAPVRARTENRSWRNAIAILGVTLILVATLLVIWRRKSG